MKEISYEWSHFANNSRTVQGLYLTKPENPSELKKRFPALRGIQFEFGKDAFDLKKLDHTAYLEEVDRKSVV